MCNGEAQEKRRIKKERNNNIDRIRFSKSLILLDKQYEKGSEILENITDMTNARISFNDLKGNY